MAKFSTSSEPQYQIERYDKASNAWDSNLRGKVEYIILRYAALKAAKLARQTEYDYRVTDALGRTVFEAEKQQDLFAWAAQQTAEVQG